MTVPGIRFRTSLVKFVLIGWAVIWSAIVIDRLERIHSVMLSQYYIMTEEEDIDLSNPEEPSYREL